MAPDHWLCDRRAVAIGPAPLNRAATRSFLEHEHSPGHPPDQPVLAIASPGRHLRIARRQESRSYDRRVMTNQDTVTGPVPHRSLRGLVALLCTAGLLATLAGSATPAPALVKDENFITAQTPGILNIEGGECFDDPADLPDAGGVVIRYRPCAQSADNQAYGFVHADDDADWDPAALRELAWHACRQLFTRIWPDDLGQGLRFYPIMPTVETWADGDRDVMCVVYRFGGRLPGSMLPGW